MVVETPVVSDCDFASDGKRYCTIRVPCSTNRSGYGSVIIPIVIVKNGSGPTVLFTGGVHGDEFEGPVALTKLCKELRPEDLLGRVVIVPALNLPAVLQGTRLSPIDGKNLNRVFPGSVVGSISDLIAHYVDTVLLQMADVVVDLHSGGQSLEYIPNVLVHRTHDSARTDATLHAAKAFGAPMVLISRDLESTGLLETAAEGYGKITLSSELGGGAVLSRESVGVAERGIWNVLRHFGLHKGRSQRSGDMQNAMVMEIEDLDAYVVAPSNGIFEPFIQLGEPVRTGEPLGQVHDFTDPSLSPRVVTSSRSGVLICRRPPAHIERGDCIAVLARPVG